MPYIPIQHLNSQIPYISGLREYYSIPWGPIHGRDRRSRGPETEQDDTVQQGLLLT